MPGVLIDTSVPSLLAWHATDVYHTWLALHPLSLGLPSVDGTKLGDPAAASMNDMWMSVVFAATGWRAVERAPGVQLVLCSLSSAGVRPVPQPGQGSQRHAEQTRAGQVGSVWLCMCWRGYDRFLEEWVMQSKSAYSQKPRYSLSTGFAQSLKVFESLGKMG